MQSDYLGFLRNLSTELRCAVNGGKPRKAQRTDSNPRASPGQVGGRWRGCGNCGVDVLGGVGGAQRSAPIPTHAPVPARCGVVGG